MPICKLLENLWAFIFRWSNVPRTIKRLSKWCTPMSRCQSQLCDVKSDITWFKRIGMPQMQQMGTYSAWDLHQNLRQKLGGVGTLVDECSFGDYSINFTGIPRPTIASSLVIDNQKEQLHPKLRPTTSPWLQDQIKLLQQSQKICTNNCSWTALWRVLTKPDHDQ